METFLSPQILHRKDLREPFFENKFSLYLDFIRSFIISSKFEPNNNDPIVMSAKHLQVAILYLLIDLILLTVEFNDIFKFSGYKPENINGNTKTCYDSPLNCTQSCMLDELCTAIATRNETARCDLFLLVYYGRVILKIFLTIQRGPKVRDSLSIARMILQGRKSILVPKLSRGLRNRGLSRLPKT